MHPTSVQTVRRLAPLLGLGLVAGVVAAAAPAADATKPDFAALDALLTNGDYAAAITTADAIVDAVRPKPRADNFLARSIELVNALKRRGVAELRVGRIDAAEATFAEAYKTFKDRDFQRLVVLATRQAGPRLPPGLVDLELAWLDLLFLRMTVVVERLEYEVSLWASADDASAEREQQLRERVDRCLDQLKQLRRAAVDARQSFGERFDLASGVVPASPSARSLAGPFHEELLDGLAALEQSRLPEGMLASISRRESDAAASAAGDERSRLRADAGKHLDQAAAALDGVMAAVTPKAGGLRPEMRAEVALLEAELLMARARVRTEAGEAAAARKVIERVLELQREAHALRKSTAPDSHPDLAKPLVLAADVGIIESRRMLAEGQADAAKVEAEEARRKLDRAAGLALGDDHPLRARLATLRQRLDRDLQGIEESIPRSDALDAAARRMIHAIEAAPIIPGSGRERPAATPSTQDSGGRSPDAAMRSICSNSPDESADFVAQERDFRRASAACSGWSSCLKAWAARAAAIAIVGRSGGGRSASGSQHGKAVARRRYSPARSRSRGRTSVANCTRWSVCLTLENLRPFAHSRDSSGSAPARFPA